MFRALTALFLIACGGGGDPKKDTGTTDPGTQTDTDTDTPTVPGDLDCTLTPSEVVPNVFFVSFSGPEGTAYVEYGRDNAFDRRTPGYTGTDHELAVLGMKAGETYQLRGVLETASGERLVCTVMEAAVPQVPPELARFDVTVPATADSELLGGFVLTTLIQTDTAWAVIFDQDGDYVWYYPMPQDAIVVTSLPGLDGQSVLWGEYDREKNLDIGVVRRISLDGRTEVVTRTYLGHHGFIEHPDGTIGWLALDFRDLDVDPTSDVNTMRLASDRILEAPEGTSDDQSFDSLFNMFDDSGMFPYLDCPHQASDFDRYGEFDIHEWTHTNSFLYVPEENAYYLFSKYTDTLLKVQRDATQGGPARLVWQMSGRDGDFTHPDGSSVWRGVEDSDLWSHSHMSHVWPGGFVMFDNGDHARPTVSEIAEYAYDETTMTVERVWNWPDPDGGWTASMGDVRKLPGGNYLAGWSSLGRINEVSPVTNEKVWEIQGSLGVVAGRVYPIPDIYDTAAW